jgi:LysM repeat protein
MTFPKYLKMAKQTRPGFAPAGRALACSATPAGRRGKENIRADLAKAMQHSDTSPYVAKLEAAIKKVQGMAADLHSVAPAVPVPVEIERNKEGRPIRVKKGDQTFSIERENGNVTRLVPTESESKTPKSPVATSATSEN